MAITELAAIEAAYEALRPLSPGARRRAVRWLSDALDTDEDLLSSVADSVVPAGAGQPVARVPGDRSPTATSTTVRGGAAAAAGGPGRSGTAAAGGTLRGGAVLSGGTLRGGATASGGTIGGAVLSGGSGRGVRVTPGGAERGEAVLSGGAGDASGGTLRGARVPLGGTARGASDTSGGVARGGSGTVARSRPIGAGGSAVAPPAFVAPVAGPGGFETVATESGPAESVVLPTSDASPAAPAARRPVAGRARRVGARAGAGKAAAPIKATRQGRRGTKPDNDRAYRRMPAPDEVMAAYRTVGTVTGLAQHFDVPTHTVQGWARRLRDQGYQIGRGAHES